ncbi:MAG TPA: hypothetical protein VH682_30730 [Gemmataceae bacterium]|jgi:hypothetical protein
MWFSSWLRTGKRSELGPYRRGRGAAGQRVNSRSRLEALEDRSLRLGQTYVVHVPGDPLNPLGWAVGSGTSGSLRYCIQQANQPGNAGSTIVFDPRLKGQIITLSGAELYLDNSMAIEGLGANSLAIRGGGSRVFAVSAAVQVQLSGMTIEHGDGKETVHPAIATDNGFGGGVLNYGTLTLSSCRLRGNCAGSRGGGIYNGGTLTLRGSIVTQNATGGDGAGGGIFNALDGQLTILCSSVTGNTPQDLSNRGCWSADRSSLSGGLLC